MAFRIRPEADFTKEFYAAAAEQLDAAASVLEHRPEGVHEAIHAFRKNLKKVRALYRLVAHSADDFQKQENARLRDAARSPSIVRDAKALVGTVQYLKDNARDGDEKAALQRIEELLSARRDWMAQAEADMDQRLQQAADAIRHSRSALEETSFPHDSRKVSKLLAKGWRRTAHKAALALKASREEATADAFHELRKRVQDYRAYHALLRDVWPAAMAARRKTAKTLVDRLGHIHDLAVLGELVEKEPQLFTRNDDLAYLLNAVIVRQQQERMQAVIEAEELFLEDAGSEAQRIALLWRSAAKA